MRRLFEEQQKAFLEQQAAFAANEERRAAGAARGTAGARIRERKWGGLEEPSTPPLAPIQSPQHAENEGAQVGQQFRVRVHLTDRARPRLVPDQLPS